MRNEIQYIATGYQWAQLHKGFPPFTTVQYYFSRLRDNGLLDAVNAVLVAWLRIAEGRNPHPSAGIIDGQSVKTDLIFARNRRVLAHLDMMAFIRVILAGFALVFVVIHYK
jgi:transposase